MLIREADASDWDRIWPLWKSIVTAGETYVFPADTDVDEGRDHWMQPLPWRTTVAVDFDGRIVGTAIHGPNRVGRGSHVATASLMVDPSLVGQGIGTQLASHVVEQATAEGYLGMQVNAVVANNDAAIGLWEKLGFVIVGTVPEGFNSATDGLVDLHIMHRALPLDEIQRSHVS